MRQNKRADNLYTIEQKAQKLFSSDEASLLEEMDEAERIWAEEKIRDPNAISSMETAAANHYEKTDRADSNKRNQTGNGRRI